MFPHREPGLRRLGRQVGQFFPLDLFYNPFVFETRKNNLSVKTEKTKTILSRSFICGSVAAGKRLTFYFSPYEQSTNNVLPGMKGPCWSSVCQTPASSLPHQGSSGSDLASSLTSLCWRRQTDVVTPPSTAPGKTTLLGCMEMLQ